MSMKGVRTHECGGVLLPDGRCVNGCLPTSRSIISDPDVVKAHPTGSKIGVASEITGFGSDYAAEPLVSLRVTLDAGVKETIYLTEKVLARMVISIQGAKTHDRCTRPKKKRKVKNTDEYQTGCWCEDCQYALGELLKKGRR